MRIATVPIIVATHSIHPLTISPYNASRAQSVHDNCSGFLVWRTTASGQNCGGMIYFSKGYQKGFFLKKSKRKIQEVNDHSS